MRKGYIGHRLDFFDNFPHHPRVARSTVILTVRKSFYLKFFYGEIPPDREGIFPARIVRSKK